MRFHSRSLAEKRYGRGQTLSSRLERKGEIGGGEIGGQDGREESMRKSGGKRRERERERDGSLRIPSASVCFTGCLRSRKERDDERLEGPVEKVVVEAIEEKERMGRFRGNLRVRARA